jgi:hypothetical protein
MEGKMERKMSYGEAVVTNILIQQAHDRRSRGIVGAVPLTRIADEVDELDPVAFPNECRVLKRALCTIGAPLQHLPKGGLDKEHCNECKVGIGKGSAVWRCKCCSGTFSLCCVCKAKIENEIIDFVEVPGEEKKSSVQKATEEETAPSSLMSSNTVAPRQPFSKSVVNEHTRGDAKGKNMMRKFSLPSRRVLMDGTAQKDQRQVAKNENAFHNDDGEANEDEDDYECAVTRHLRKVNAQVTANAPSVDVDEYDEYSMPRIPSPPIAMNAREREAYERDERRRLFREQLRAKKQEEQQKDREDFLARLHEITAKKQAMPQSHYVQLYEERMVQARKKEEERMQRKKEEEEIENMIRKQKGAASNLSIQARAKSLPREKKREDELKATVAPPHKFSNDEVAARRKEIDDRAAERRERRRAKELEEASAEAQRQQEEISRKEIERAAARETMRTKALQRIVKEKEMKQTTAEKQAQEEAEAQRIAKEQKRAAAARAEELRKQRETREATILAEREATIKDALRKNHVAKIVKEEHDRYDKEVKDRALERRRNMWRKDIEVMKDNLVQRSSEAEESQAQEMERRIAFEERCKMQRMAVLEGDASMFDPRPFLRGRSTGVDSRRSDTNSQMSHPRTAPE